MNKCQPIIIIILMLAMIQIAWGVDCEISSDGNVTWATINSTRFMGCADTTSDLAIVNKLDCGTDYYVRCKDATTVWGYESFTTEPCSEEEPMAALAITIFILLIAGTLFVLSAKKDILRNKYANLIVRRSFLVLGIYLMILNSAIMATIAADAGIALTQEMFFYMRLFGLIGYPSMVLLMMSALIQSLRQLKIDKQNKRTGDENSEAY